MPEQVPFGLSGKVDDFANNPEPRCPCVLLLDTSGSMQGQPIKELNSGLIAFRDELMADEMAKKRVEVATISFGPVNVVQDFTSADSYTPTPLVASGDTPMGEAILTALDLLRARKDKYRSNGIAFYRPWIFLITDGAPTDDTTCAAEAVLKGEVEKSFALFAVAVQGAPVEVLNKICPRGALRLQGLKFRELFMWLSSSMKSVSHSTPQDEILLPPPGWAKV